jgi:hypothetical protein
MRLRHSTILFAVLAAAFLPRMARAQDYEYCSNYVCESDVEYDPSSSELNGYARTVDYGDFGETALKAVATLGDSNGNTVADDTDVSFGEADAYVWWAAGTSYGQYGIRGDHYYIIEDDYLEGGDFLESTYWSVDVSGPPANITNITWTPADSSWQAGSSYTFTVSGTGFGSSPMLNIGGPDDTNYYNASCMGTACDTAISGSLSIPSTAPSGYALVIVTPVGFTGLGFGQNPPSPPPVSTTEPVTAAVQCPTTIQMTNTVPLSLPYEDPFMGTLLTGIGLAANMQVSGALTNNDGAQIQEVASQVSNTCPAIFGNICSGSATWTVGFGSQHFGQTFPSKHNMFQDWHVNVGADSILNAVSMQSCAATCSQAYSCNGAQLGGAFTIQYSFTAGSIMGDDVTFVDVTKSAND